MKKILTVFGTRPEAIKMAPVIKAIAKDHNLQGQVCITAQHREMLDQILDIFDINPDYDLNIMKSNQDLFDVTTKVLLGFKDVLMESRPDIVLVHGDTTTTMAASLAAFYLKFPVGHVEAGLRTYNKYAPFPEEINRHITGVIADYHFAPTEWAKNNLIKEGIPEKKIFVTGNTVVDALLIALDKIRTSDKQRRFDTTFNFLDKKKRLILITAHRRESFGDGFKNICLAIKELASMFPECEFLYPVHMNPNVQVPVLGILGGGNLKNIHLIKPLEYLSFVYLISRAYLIITDSGGIQEEAPSLGKPVLVMRDTTERPEAVEAGIVKLIGTDRKKIVESANELLMNAEVYQKMSIANNLYGDGKAAENITKILSMIF